MGMEFLDPAELAKVKAEAAKPKTRGSSAKKKGDHTDRTITTWFQLQHTYGTCVRQPDGTCVDDRPSTLPGFKNAMLADVSDTTDAPYKICRPCFLDGAKPGSAQTASTTQPASSTDSHTSPVSTLDNRVESL